MSNGTLLPQTSISTSSGLNKYLSNESPVTILKPFSKASYYNEKKDICLNKCPLQEFGYQHINLTNSHLAFNGIC